MASMTGKTAVTHSKCMRTFQNIQRIGGHEKNWRAVLKRGKQLTKLSWHYNKHWTAKVARVPGSYVAIIHSLAEQNVPLRGFTDTLYQTNNGNFLKEVELIWLSLSLFSKSIYCEGARCQSYILPRQYYSKWAYECISERIVECMVTKHRQSKYFSIILDCTPGLSHKEQLSVIMRIVAAEGTAQIQEYFMGFVEAEKTTGLSTLILKKT